MCDPLSSQKYRTVLGIRNSERLSASIEQRIIKKINFELIYSPSTRLYEKSIEGLILYHKPIFTRSISIFGGAGYSVLLANSNFEKCPKGILLKAGIGFTFWRLNTSWDVKPVYFYKNETYSLDYSTGFSIRYVILKEPKRKKFSFFRKKN